MFKINDHCKVSNKIGRIKNAPLTKFGKHYLIKFDDGTLDVQEETNIDECIPQPDMPKELSDLLRRYDLNEYEIARRNHLHQLYLDQLKDWSIRECLIEFGRR